MRRQVAAVAAAAATSASTATAIPTADRAQSDHKDALNPVAHLGYPFESPLVWMAWLESGLKIIIKKFFKSNWGA